jgi:hypothetical protein
MHCLYHVESGKAFAGISRQIANEFRELPFETPAAQTLPNGRESFFSLVRTM